MGLFRSFTHIFPVALASSLILSQVSQANPEEKPEMRYYDVEILVIENITEKARKSENWPVNKKIEMPVKSFQLGLPVIDENLPQGVDPSEAYKLLPADTFRLTEYVEKISETENQRVIYHTSWRQPGLDNEASLPVYFTTDVPAPPEVEDLIKPTLTANDDEINQATEEAFKIKNAVLEGLLRVTLSRYLHLEAELTLRNKENTQVNVTEQSQNISDNPFAALDLKAKIEAKEIERQKQQVIYLNQKRRRMRSKELHYIDHPVISLLVLMTPYEKPEEDTTTPVNKPVSNSGTTGAIQR